MDERPLRITVLGQVGIDRASGGAEATAWRGRRAEFVFAYLAVEHDRLVTQGELGDALWPERLPDTWEAGLRGVLTEVRRFLSEGGLDPSEVVTTLRLGYRMQLPAGVTVDLDEARTSLVTARTMLADGAAKAAAERARRAGELARLPFLPNHEGIWVDDIRRELASIHARALELEARAHAVDGDLAAATTAAERLVQAEPFNETAHQLRIRLLGQAGDRAGATVAYEHCRDVLATKLDVDPSDETRAVYRAAIEHDRAADPPLPGSARPPVTPAGLATLSVLVVEDHDFQRRTALMLLRNLGIGTVAEASNGITALALLAAASAPPDVIVCDIDMPGMDGVEFITHVAERELASAVIIASALDAKVIDAVRAVGEGHGLQILGVLEKPLTARGLGELLAGYRPNAGSRSPTANPIEGLVSITGADARSAIDDGRIRFHLRPGVDVATGRVTTADTVPAWLEPGGALVPPEVFVPVLARERLIAALSRRALEAACADVGAFAARGTALRISVALAPDSPHMPEFAAEAGDVARSAGIDPARISFALDERALRMAPGAALGLLTRLRVKGFGIALANFGAGNASIEQLRAVPFTEVALAPALVSGAAGDPQRVRALEDTVQLGRELGVTIVGNGCASEDDMCLLLAVGCDRISGGFIADAMPAHELPDWLASWNPDRLEVGGSR